MTWGGHTVGGNSKAVLYDIGGIDVLLRRLTSFPSFLQLTDSLSHFEFDPACFCPNLCDTPNCCELMSFLQKSQKGMIDGSAGVAQPGNLSAETFRIRRYVSTDSNMKRISRA